MTELASKPWTIGFQIHSVLCRTTFCLSSYVTYLHGTSRVALVVKINAPANAGDIRDVGSILRSGRSPGGGHGNPLQYSHLENPMDRGACWYSPQRHKESDTAQVTQHTHTHICIQIHIYMNTNGTQLTHLKNGTGHQSLSCLIFYSFSQRRI